MLHGVRNGPLQLYSTFSQTCKIVNTAINANFVFTYICIFLHYLHHMMLVNVKWNISWHKRNTFQEWKLHWFCWFWMAQPRWIWQYLHSCIGESLQKTTPNRQTLMWRVRSANLELFKIIYLYLFFNLCMQIDLNNFLQTHNR